MLLNNTDLTRKGFHNRYKITLEAFNDSTGLIPISYELRICTNHFMDSMLPIYGQYDSGISTTEHICKDRDDVYFSMSV